ncbi:MAG: methylated-DNA--[protein]-cysteine S-methyltransferase [Tannerellaceae bacterium]|nr:methylated-DNA--[protein]-cysteine S-methyltransferase [Tannerellaceae bacterium]MCD8262760.1 methylated-DNA--[protein]-cysteine S-methyltransferase [Tannerellaceae bacterium]
MDTSDFYQTIYNVVAQIPEGKVVTYGQLVRLAGYPDHSRLAGKAISLTPARLQLPCHRVVNSRGRTVPGWNEQRQLLEAEGVTFRTNGTVYVTKHQWEEILP